MWTKREGLAGLLCVEAGGIGPSFWLELEGLVEIPRIMHDGPGACVYFSLRITLIRLERSLNHGG